MPNERVTIQVRDGECALHVATPAADGPWPAVIVYIDGDMALAAAGTYPDRCGAVASFHGGNLATDAPASPHLFVPEKAKVYITAAENDGSYPLEMAERLEKALAQAGVRYRLETYPAAHGWMKPDFPIYNHAAADCSWAEMLALFGRNLHCSR